MLPSASNSNLTPGNSLDTNKSMNALKSLKEYILDMVESVNGVKVLILDEYTVGLII